MIFEVPYESTVAEQLNQIEDDGWTVHQALNSGGAYSKWGVLCYRERIVNIVNEQAPRSSDVE